MIGFALKTKPGDAIGYSQFGIYLRSRDSSIDPKTLDSRYVGLTITVYIRPNWRAMAEIRHFSSHRPGPEILRSPSTDLVARMKPQFSQDRAHMVFNRVLGFEQRNSNFLVCFASSD